MWDKRVKRKGEILELDSQMMNKVAGWNIGSGYEGWMEKGKNA